MVMEEASLIGVAIMKGSGKIICGTAKVNLSTKRVTYLKDNGRKMYRMANFQ